MSLLRVLSFLVALALAWNGLAAQELPSVPPVSAAGFADQAAPQGVTPGSIEDHQLDDQPLQTHAEVPADTSGLLLALALLREPAWVTRLPHEPASAALPSPCLDGPHRPPCEAARIG